MWPTARMARKRKPAMSTATTTATPVPTGSREHATGPFGRITFASIATGVIGAAVTTFAVLPSASEARVVGAALLAFAAGWGVLAWLTTRYTNRPQTWATVPAVALAVSGV